MDEHIPLHIYATFANSKWVCKLCNNEFLSDEQFQNHLNKDHDQDKSLLKCMQCNKVLANKRALRDHTLLMHTKKTFTCDYCGMIFKTRSSIVGHMAVHIGLQPFSCKICGTKFKYKKGLVRHMRVKHEQKNNIQKEFQCSLCPKSFSRCFPLKDHLFYDHYPIGSDVLKIFTLTHCIACNLKFIDADAAKQHMEEMHKFRCYTCEKNFSTNKNLKAHMKGHDPNAIRPYPCKVIIKLHAFIKTTFLNKFNLILAL